LVIVLRWNRLRGQHEARESLSERLEDHQASIREESQDLEDQTRIIFSSRSSDGRVASAASAAERDLISKSAKAHAFLGNVRATLSTHAGFKAISIARARKVP
jgi:hypothetical protein